MHHNIYASILVMFLTIYAGRALPLTLIRREIRNPFIQSFLYLSLIHILPTIVPRKVPSTQPGAATLAAPY